MDDLKGTALVYSGGLLDDLHAKTAHGLLRVSERFDVLGLIDQRHFNQTSADIVSHCHKNVPIFEDLNQALKAMDKKPDFMVIGVAFGVPFGFENVRNHVAFSLQTPKCLQFVQIEAPWKVEGPFSW